MKPIRNPINLDRQGMHTRLWQNDITDGGYRVWTKRILRTFTTVVNLFVLAVIKF